MVKKGRLKKREKKKKRGDFKLLSVHSAFNGAFLRVLPLLGCALWSDKSRAGEIIPSGLCAKGLVFHSSSSLSPGCDEKLGGRVRDEVGRGGEQPLKVPLPWRRSWAKQDFHQSTNRR